MASEKREFTRAFRAMGTDVLGVVNLHPGRRQEAEAALAALQALFEEHEAALSRFRPDSELSRLNRSTGRPFQASPLLFEAVSAAVSAAALTGGLFDPTVLGALEAAGYDRSFEAVPERVPAPSRRPAAPEHGGCGGARRSRTASEVLGSHSRAVDDGAGSNAWSRVQLDPGARTVMVPPGLGLDLGGIGKGWTVDRVADRLRPVGGFAVDAGGDLYAAGTQADGSPWTVGVEDPFQAGRDLLVVEVRDRALATSTTMRRRWARAGRPMHHLIDPGTGRPSESGVASVTVMARSAALAEVLAKAALLAGMEAGGRLLDEHEIRDWVMVGNSGEVRLSARLREVR